MFTMFAQSGQKAISAVAAITIVAFGGLVLDQAHLAAAPRGTVEIGELTPVGEAGMTLAALPEVVVVGKRVSAGGVFAGTTQLPEIVVIASRIAQQVARSDSDGPSMKADAESALLK